MQIDYLDAFDELKDRDTFKGQQWFGHRQQLVEEYSWGVPNEDAIRYIAEVGDIIEVGAGTGYWAHLIEQVGGSVLAIDSDPPDVTYTQVEEAPAHEYFDEIRDSPVLMVWPPCDNDMAFRVAKQEPSHILYVGEQRGGCTATDAFFNYVQRRYGLVGKLGLPSYAGVEDDLFHYARKI